MSSRNVEPDLRGRTLVVGDLHGNTSRFSQHAEIAAEEGISHIIQLGDFGYGFGQFDKGKWRFVTRINKMCENHGITLDFVDGNHENFDALPE